MKKILPIALRVLAVILLTAAVACLILYQQGYFNISFISRPTEQTEEGESGEKPLPPAENISQVGEEEIIEASIDYEKENAALPTKEQYPDRVLTEEVYRQGKTLLLRVEPDAFLPDLFSYRQEEVKQPIRVESERGGYQTVMKVTTEDRPALTMYMGNIFADYGQELSLLSGQGALLMNGFDPEKLTPAYARSADGDPLFLFEGQYYRLVPGTGMFLEVEAEKVRTPALSFDFPRYYGQDHAGLTPFYDEEKKCFGYRNEEGETVISPLYDEAFAFAENGYAAVINNGILQFIDTEGKVKIDVSGQIVVSDMYAFDGYYEPDTRGIESLGHFYFDHGLVCVRRHVMDYSLPPFVLDDYDLLLYENGETFPLPGGYTLVGYSDGVALLEKDGKYGFLDYTGYWVAQPIYSSASPFREGLAVIGLANGKKGMIDTEGNLVLPFLYDYVSPVSGGVVLTYESAHGWQIFNKTVEKQ